MDEGTWLTSIDPNAMLNFLRACRRTSDRKHRLVAVGCCRRIWRLLADERSRRVVEVAEEYLDGRVGIRAKSWAKAEAGQAAGELAARVVHATSAAERRRRKSEAMAAGAAAAVLQESSVWQYATAAQLAARQAADGAAVAVKFAGQVKGMPGRHDAQKERAAQCVLLRCIFGNPFRPLPRIVPFLEDHEGLLVRLARAAYQERELSSAHLDQDRLNVLADALEEGGGNDELVAHLHETGPHYRGCFVVDWLLSKE